MLQNSNRTMLSQQRILGACRGGFAWSLPLSLGQSATPDYHIMDDAGSEAELKNSFSHVGSVQDTLVDTGKVMFVLVRRNGKRVQP